MQFYSPCDYPERRPKASNDKIIPKNNKDNFPAFCKYFSCVLCKHFPLELVEISHGDLEKEKVSKNLSNLV